MAELDDDGELILGPHSEEEIMLEALEHFSTWTGTFREKGEDVWGYVVINRFTGIVEAEGNNMVNSLIAMYYLEDRYKAVIPDIEAEMRRQKKEFAGAMPMLFGDFDERGNGGLDS